MNLFLESQDVDLWDIIQIGPYKPKKINQVGVEIDKPKEECMWEKDFVQPVKMCFQSYIFTMLSSLKNPFEVVSIER